MNIRRFFAWLYDAAEPSPNRSARAIFGDRSSGASEDTATRWERKIIIDQCRDLYRNNAVARGVVKRLKSMVVGNGITPQATTTDAEWNRRATELWREWAEAPETSGRRRLQDILKLCIAGIMVEGGAALLKHSDGSIELVEMERFRAEGVDTMPYRIGKNGRVSHWCIWDRDEFGSFGVNSRKLWVHAENVLTLFPSDRADQIMPLPQLSGCVNQLRDVDELNRFTLQQAKVQAVAGIIHKRGADGNKLNLGGSRLNKTDDTAAQLKTYAEATGQNVIDTTGDVHTVAPATPSGTYEPFMMLNLKLIAMAIGLPVDVMMLWFSDGTYSSSKATLTQAKEAVSEYQEQLIHYLLRPLWLWKMVQAVANDQLPPPPMGDNGLPQYEAVYFQRPGWAWIDPSDSMQTDLLAVSSGLASMSELAEKNGKKYIDVLRSKAEDAKAVAAIAAEYGIPPESLSNLVIPGASPAGGANAQTV